MELGNEDIAVPPGETIFVYGRPSTYSNYNEGKLLNDVANICSLSIEDTKELLSYGLLNFIPKDFVLKKRLCQRIFSLMGVSKDLNIVYHCFHFLRKRGWFPGLVDVIGVLMSWGATPDTLQINPLPSSILCQLIVNEVDSLPTENQLEKVMNFVVYSNNYEYNELKLLIKMLVRCATDLKLISVRSFIKIGIGNCLNAVNDDAWENGFIEEIHQELKFEKYQLPNAVIICTQIIPKTDRSNKLILYISFYLLKNLSDSISQQKEDSLENVMEEANKKSCTNLKDERDLVWESRSGMKEILHLLQKCRNLWNMNIHNVYYIVVLINDMVSRLPEEKKDMEILRQIRSELSDVRSRLTRNQLMTAEKFSFLDLISKILGDWEVQFKKNMNFSLMHRHVST